MHASRYIDEAFDINNCLNYIVSIQCALDGFSFSVLDTNNKRFVVLSEYELNAASDFELNNNIINLIGSEPILQKEFKQVYVEFTSLQSTLIPSSLFDAAEVKEFAKLQFETNANEDFVYKAFGKEILCLSVIPIVIKETFKSLFRSCKFLPSGSGLINFSRYEQSNGQLLIAAKLNHLLQILQIDENDKIKGFNTYYVVNDKDAVYYLLNFARQSELDKNTKILLMGKIIPKTMLPKLLKRYFYKVDYSCMSHPYHFASPLLKEPKHYHLSLTHLALCE